MIELRSSINNKENCESENPKKPLNIVKKILEFNTQQNVKGIKILTP